MFRGRDREEEAITKTKREQPMKKKENKESVVSWKEINTIVSTNN